MQVSVEATTGLERRITVGVPADEIDNAVNAKLNETAKQVRIDGFRPGKVPVREVKRRYGASVRAEVVGDVIQRTYYEAVSQEKLQPAGMPKIEPKTDKAGSDLEYIAVVEVYPEIAVTGLSGISVAKPRAEITDADVQQMLEELQQQHKQLREKDSEAALGDSVVIDYEGAKDGEPFEGGSAENSTLELGSGSMIPGFEEGIVGAKAGEERVLNLSFPEDYHSEDLKGQQVEFKITVQAVNESVLPVIDEEFCKKFGISEGGVEKLQQDVRKNMERELKSAVKNNIRTQVMDGLLSITEFEVPAALVDGEIDRQREAALQQFGGGGNIDPSMLPADLFKDKAQRAVKAGLVMGEIIKDNELKADADKVKAFIEEQASGYEHPEEFVNYYYSNEELLRNVESVVLEQQVVEFVLDQAQISEKETTYKELMKPAQSTGASE